MRPGTSKVHATRHTFAHAMEATGAATSEIQRRLGHSSIATTGRYLAKLASGDNPHAAQLETLFGLAEPTAARPNGGKVTRPLHG